MPRELSPATALLIKFISIYRDCCHELLQTDACELPISSLCLCSVLEFSRDEQDNVTLGAHHQTHWLECNTFCNGSTCRGLDNGWQWTADPSGRPVTDSRLHSTTASDGPLHSTKWDSTCQQLRNNGMALEHLAERVFSGSPDGPHFREYGL